MSDNRRGVLRDNPEAARTNAPPSGYLENILNAAAAADKENVPTGTGFSPTDKAAFAPAATPSQPAPNSRKRKAPATPPAPQRLPTSDELEDIVIDAPMRENCDQVRRKINRALDAGIITKTGLAGEIGVSVKSLNGFLREHGAFKGQGYSSYPAAWEYFKKLDAVGYKIPNKTAAAKKQKTDSADGAEADIGKVDVSDIHLEGEETDEVPVYDTCDEIRRKIDAYLRRPGVTQAQFCRDIHAQHQSAKRPANIHTSQLARFRGMKGARAGATSSVFYGAYVFFEKLRIKEKKPMTQHRKDMEEAWPNGFDRTDDGRIAALRTPSPRKLLDIMDNVTPATSSNAVQPIQHYKRTLVGVRKVTAKKKIEDHRTVVTVDNWTVVGLTAHMKRYKVDDLVVYMEIDSFIPKTNRFFELWPRMTDVFDGEQGLRVRSHVVAGTWSQGMIFPLEQFPEITVYYHNRVVKVGQENATTEILKYSFADHLGIKKWEYPTHERPVTGIIGELSALIHKPGNWRIQDIGNVVFNPRTVNTRTYQVTEKLDGVSMHVYKVSNSSKDLLDFFPALRPLPIADKPDGDGIPIPPTMQTERCRVGVCNHSHEFFDDGKNIYWETAKTSGIIDKIHQIPFRNIAIQGELVGSHIQGNTMRYPEGKHEFVVFGIWDIGAKEYLAFKTVELLCKTLGIAHVPVLGYGPVTKYGKNVKELLAYADNLGTGKYGGLRRGLDLQG
ncbi:unnamed protein product [Sordaria macrospora k-hell]|uniref:WGS project CABT00000000 data, contig 2.6 n=1 Tax=Sordaria macrospora (strain ATCC MYA-333 / DSM 997 / K(L3346) / K-hell) TaxID=771870 RepID=F7VTH1_SORMK|nr:uncharacterized protein SMAC_05981 [Sordaria macrospora k-hell]CCC08627.1 unnamed protein product [Sordaria macrospora k-hell]